MNKYEIDIANKIAVHVSSNYEILNKENMRMGNGLFNNRCHTNSVQCLRDPNNDALEVYGCIIMDKGSLSNPVTHFINKCEDGMYVDNTLGWQYELYDYYIIKKISEEECNHIWDSLENIRTNLVNLHCGKLKQKLCNIKAYRVL